MPNLVTQKSSEIAGDWLVPCCPCGVDLALWGHAMLALLWDHRPRLLQTLRDSCAPEAGWVC